MTVEKLNFRISTGLKDLLGRDLITDEFIAVFELVKNSYDASAKNVYVVFENMQSLNGKIKIIDDGKGMDHDDIYNKWMFVAYSAKKEEVEDENTVDYRANLIAKRYYAGAKGIGRFSCDRLGRTLKLYSKKLTQQPTTESLSINWGNFEKDSKQEFKNIEIEAESIDRFPDEYKKYNLIQGTIIEITNLRDFWNRDKILDLKTSLAKLILPKFNHEEKVENTFNIIVEAEHEHKEDIFYKEKCESSGLIPDLKRIVNGPVDNFIFETLNLKTTQIISTISLEGDKIKTKLIDRGTFIYEIEEENDFTNLHDITYHLYFLNQAAKWNFTNLMNTEPVNYGNVFIYKNGFRVQPYGNPRDDSLGIDARKSQGYKRFLGTREIIGKIEIHGENNELRETTSRAGGLITNSTYGQLIECFYRKVIIRLEKYVVEAKNWGVNDEDLKDLNDSNTKEEIVKLISNVSSNQKIKAITYNDEIIDLLNIQEENSAKKLIRNFRRIASESDNSDLVEKVTRLETRLIELKQAKDEAEKQIENERELHKKKEEELKKTNKYLLAIAKDLSPEALGLIHHISHESAHISPKIESLIKVIKNGNVDKNYLLNKLTELKIESDKITKISRLVIRSNFDLMVSEQKADIVGYIDEYVKLYKEINEDLKLKIVLEKEINEFMYRFSMINVSIILDNLLSNSRKANATQVKLILKLGMKKSLRILYSDNGKGVNDVVKDSMFELGITTTNGSGIGLYTVKKLINEMGGQFFFSGNNEELEGATFEIIL